MTTTVTGTPPGMRQLDDDGLLAVYSGGDERARREALREAARRDQADRAARYRHQLEAEWYDHVHAQRMAFEAEGLGYVLNAEARRVNASAAERGKVAVSEWQVWTGPAWMVEKYGSDEIKAFFRRSPRLTLAGYQRQRHAAGRAQYQEWRTARDSVSGGAGHDDYERDGDTAGPGLAEPATRAFRQGAAAPASAGRPRGAVPRDGSTASAGGRDTGAGARRAAGPAEPAGRQPGRGAAVTTAARDVPPGIARYYQGAEETAARWREEAAGDMAAAQAAGSRERAARLGCKHSRTRFGGPGQCEDCPAGQGNQVAVREAAAIVIQREPVNGARLLTDAYTALGHFAMWPSEAAHVTAALYSAHTHARDEKTGLPVWQYEPRLFLTSSEGGSGKSWMGRLTAKLSLNGKMLVEANKPNLVRLIEERATPVITELDVLVGTGKRSQWFTGIANASYEPDQSTSRVQNGKRIDIPLLCPMILDGLDSVEKSTGVELKTLLSRCIIIRVKRAPDGYRAPRFDKTARAVFALGAQKLGAWMAQEVRDGIEDHIPEVPEGLGNRPAALWEPLLAVADRAGGTWPERARQACADLSSDAGVNEDDQVEQDYRAALDSWASGGVLSGAEDA